MVRNPTSGVEATAANPFGRAAQPPPFGRAAQLPMMRIRKIQLAAARAAAVLPPGADSHPELPIFFVEPRAQTAIVCQGVVVDGAVTPDQNFLDPRPPTACATEPTWPTPGRRATPLRPASASTLRWCSLSPAGRNRLIWHQTDPPALLGVGPSIRPVHPAQNTFSYDQDNSIILRREGARLESAHGCRRQFLF